MWLRRPVNAVRDTSLLRLVVRWCSLRFRTLSPTHLFDVPGGVIGASALGQQPSCQAVAALCVAAQHPRKHL